MYQWELCGVGDVDPGLVAGASAIDMTADGTRVIGVWEPSHLTGVVLGLMASGFELVSVRRIDADP